MCTDGQNMNNNQSLLFTKIPYAQFTITYISKFQTCDKNPPEKWIWSAHKVAATDFLSEFYFY